MLDFKTLAAQKLLVSKTYAELAEMVANETLQPGTFYMFEHQTKHVIPTTEDIHTGVTEHLILQAIAANKFHVEAKSVEYPADIIEYDFNNNLCEDNTTERTGWITRRKDTELNNDVIGFDFKNCKFRRYAIDLTASGVVEWDYDNANYHRLDLVHYDAVMYVCIKDLVDNVEISNTEFWLQLFGTNLKVLAEVETTIYLGEHTVILARSEELTDLVDSYMFDWTNIDNKNNYIVANGLRNNVFFNEFYNNTFLKLGHSNTSNSATFLNFITNAFTQNIFISDFYNNKIYSQFSQNIKTGGEFYYNTISGGGFYYNTISGGGFSLNTIYGSEFYNNTISGGEFYNNTISGGSFSYNTISGGSFSYNTISRDFYYNTISGGSFSYNTISGSEFYNNTIPINFKFNITKNIIDTIDFSLATHVAASYNCEIGKNSDDVLYLSYIDGDNVQQIVDITD